MSKTYILEPTEINFSYDERFDFLTNNVSIDWYELSEGATLQFDNVVFKYATTDSSTDPFVRLFTEDGIAPEEVPDRWATINNDAIMNVKHEALPKENCTLTFSIYTGEDDPDGIPGLEDKNVVYEYQLVANNNIKDILMAVIEKNGANAVNIPGYSVMELLVENLLVFHKIAEGDLATFRATTFANDAEKIAWIIRHMGGELG